jgi:hypothetical protein
MNGRGMVESQEGAAEKWLKEELCRRKLVHATVECPLALRQV